MVKNSAAQTFRALHASNDILLLPNAWDAGTARLIAQAGAKAIATTSAGVAWALGYPDGDTVPEAALLGAIDAIARVTNVPLSVDLEGGYSTDAQAVAALACELAERGVAGINIEDGTSAPDLLVAKIEAIRSELRKRDADLFINARTDVYLLSLREGDAALTEAIARAKAYEAAGADGFFVPYLTDLQAMHALASASSLALNVLAVPDLPALADLQRNGIRRVSAGSSIAVLAYGTAVSASKQFLKDATLGPRPEHALNYANINALF